MRVLNVKKRLPRNENYIMENSREKDAKKESTGELVIRR